jgi:hypothetical protein
MSPLKRLLRELGQLRGVLDPADYARYARTIAFCFPAITHARSLVPADRQMLHNIKCSLAGASIHVPVGEMTELLGANDPTPTFGAIREMYGGNVYLRPFCPDLTVRTVVDLGSNRGLFSVLAAIVLKARTVVGVEPAAFYEPVLQSLLRANGLEGQGLHRITAFAASEHGPGKVTISKLMDQYGMDRIGFLKCDIEGAEFDVLLHNNGYLERVDHIGMELHQAEGDVRRLNDAMVGYGFQTLATDQFGRPTPIVAADYLYASRRPFHDT